MLNSLRFIVIALILGTCLSPCARAATWARTFGTTLDDSSPFVLSTSDGGFLVLGQTDAGAGLYEGMIAKIDSFGTIVWQKQYTGAGDENISTAIELAGGNFLAVGRTTSSGQGGDDLWLLEIDSAGSIVWQQTLGGAQTDHAPNLLATSDGGYALSGRTDSFGAGLEDYWVIRLDATRNFLWQQTCGDTGEDSAGFLQLLGETPGGGLIVAGDSDSYTADPDFWVVKVNALSGITWQYTFGGDNNDVPTALAVQDTGDIYVVGWTRSFGSGKRDYWIMKLSANGSVQWEKVIGGAEDDYPRSVVILSDGEFDTSTVDQVTRLNRSGGKNTQINCVAIGSQVKTLQRLASLNGPGNYVEVP